MTEPANLTLEAANATLNSTANDSIRQGVNQMGGFSLDAILNSGWGDGLAQALNGWLHTDFFTGGIVVALVPVITILLIYWKWNAIMQAVHTFGQTLLILLAAYVVMKAVGVF